MRKRTVSRLSEDQITQLLKLRYGSVARGLRVGIGDDAAVLRPAGAREDYVVATDLLVEGVDFRRAWMRPGELGHKALAVNLSDLAAMGARPRFYLVSLGLPQECRESWIDTFFRGMTSLGGRWRAVLVGGDLSRSDIGIVVSVIVVGETAKKRALLRSTARPGDVFFVTGTLGKAAAGLRLLESGKRRGRTAAERAAVRAQLAPEPRCEVGRWLASHGLASGMMDLSDGLSSDLPRLCDASGTGAILDGHCLPAFQESRAWGCDPTALALDGGEDFELLFAVPPWRVARLRRTYPRLYPPVTAIGIATRRRSVRWRPAPGLPTRPLPRRGWDHLRLGRSR